MDLKLMMIFSMKMLMLFKSNKENILENFHIDKGENLDRTKVHMKFSPLSLIVFLVIGLWSFITLVSPILNFVMFK